MSINDYSETPGSNTAIAGINIDEGCSPAGINNALRQIMADLAVVAPDIESITEKAPVEDPTFTTRVTAPIFRATSTTGVSLSGSSHGMQIGGSGGANLALDANEVQARINGSAGPLRINVRGGDIILGSETTETSVAGALNLSSADIDMGQRWQDMTASRSPNVTYQNNTGRPIQVSVLIESTSDFIDAFLLVGSDSDALEIVGTVPRQINAPMTLVAEVPNGHFYAVGTVVTVTRWSELR